LCFLFSPDGSSRITAGSSGSRRGIAAAGRGAARLDITALDRTVCRLYQAGLAPATQKTYLAGKRRYLQFCQRSGSQPVPVAEGSLCRFVAFLQMEGLRHSTVKAYLSAVRHLQVSQGLGDPQMSSMPRLELVVRGLKREQAGAPSKPRLPITPAILRQIRHCWKDSQEWDKVMVWAAMCLCFFGFLRSGEVVVPDDSTFLTHLSTCHLLTSQWTVYLIQPFWQSILSNPRQTRSGQE